MSKIYSFLLRYITAVVQNKTENPFSLKDDDKVMTSKTNPMSTYNLTNPLIPIFTIPNVDIYNIL